MTLKKYIIIYPEPLLIKFLKGKVIPITLCLHCTGLHTFYSPSSAYTSLVLMHGGDCYEARCISNACYSTMSVYFSIRTFRRAGDQNDQQFDRARTNLYLGNLCITKHLYGCYLSEPNKERNLIIYFGGVLTAILTQVAVQKCPPQ